MRKRLLVIASLVLVISLKSQIVFAPPGAEWSYSFYIWPVSFDNYKIKYVKDTLDGPDVVKQLLAHAYYRTFNICDPGKVTHRILIKQKGDTVFFKHKRTPGWQILYNFAASPGQYWMTAILDENNNLNGFFHLVDSVSTIQEKGFTLKKLVVSMTFSAGTEKMTVIERYGNLGYLFNYENYPCVSDGDRYERFLCYSDSIFGAKQFSSYPCNYLNYSFVDEKTIGRRVLRMFPNPSSGRIWVQIENTGLSEHQLEIQNALGKLIWMKKIDTSETELNVFDLPNGLYLLRCVDNGQIIATEKLLIHR